MLQMIPALLVGMTIEFNNKLCGRQTLLLPRIVSPLSIVSDVSCLIAGDRKRKKLSCVLHVDTSSSCFQWQAMLQRETLKILQYISRKPY